MTNKTIEYTVVALPSTLTDGGFVQIYNCLTAARKQIPEEFIEEAWLEIDSVGTVDISYSRPATPEELAKIKADCEAEAVQHEADAARIRKYAAGL